MIEERCNPRAVHEAMLFIPEYRAAVPVDRAASGTAASHGRTRNDVAPPS